ncbi:MAG: sugar ABC transporter ATP-binding protein [Bernardetiaceae bacterium]|jgi:ribose transport system ATP-binding protein|nr:sugar ABC transporter ATP-binding protein [Bernardetiaceae bacterium]
MENPLLVIEDIHKAFGPVQALRGVSLNVGRGEVHALIGENGAGKSTLMKVLSGAHAPDRGRLLLNGQAYRPSGPASARQAGVAMIYQELTLAPHLNVEENMMLGLETSRAGLVQSQAAQVRQALDWLGQTHIMPQTPLRKLNIGQQQLVEIARALVMEAKLVIMDEPTSSLTAEDTRALFGVIRKLKQSGVTVIYISHFLEEVREICDRYTVLRDGQTVATGVMEAVTIPEIIRHMVGRPVTELYPQAAHDQGAIVLEVTGLSAVPQPKNVSFSLRRGEILGVAGLVGAGRSEVVRNLFGLQRAQNGQVSIKGHPQIKAHYLTPAQALGQGINLLSENRKEEGLALNLSIAANLTLSRLGQYVRKGLLHPALERQAAQEWVKNLNVKCHSVDQPIGGLSGGNQQKVCLARLLHHGSDILFLDEPTRGIDVGSKAEIYRLIHQLAAQGTAVVMISSYLPELFGVCDSLVVMHRGQMSAKRDVAAWDEQQVMLYATSGAEPSPLG